MGSPGKEDYILSGMWDMNSPWNKAVAHLLKISLVFMWENILVRINLQCNDSGIWKVLESNM